MWSSCPWVRTTAAMSSSRCSMMPKSGRIRSTPGCSASGNSTPQSMTTSVPSYSSTAMLRPISPSPPSAMTRSPPAVRGGAAFRSRGGLARSAVTVASSQVDASSGEVGAQLLELRGGGVDQGWPDGAGRQAHRVERGLDQDDALGAEDAGVDRQQALVDRARLDQVAALDGGDELCQPRADLVADDADDADGTDGEQREVQHVLAAVDRKSVV